MSNGQNTVAQVKRQQYDNDLARFTNDPRFVALDGDGRKDALGQFFQQFTTPYLQFQGVTDPSIYQEEFLDAYWKPDKKKEDLAEDLLPDSSAGQTKSRPVKVTPEDDTQEKVPGLSLPDQPDEIAASILSALPGDKKEPSPTGSYAGDWFEKLGAGALTMVESQRKAFDFTQEIVEIPGDAIADGLQRIGLGPQTSKKIGQFANKMILKKTGRIINATNQAYEAVKDTDVWQEAFVETPRILRERSDRYDKLISEYRKAGEWDKVLGATMLYGAESLPNSLIAMFGGPAGLAAVGGMAAGEKYDEIKDADMPEYMKKANALATGLFEALTEMIGTAAVGRLIKQGYKAIGRAATKDLVETGLKGWFRNAYKKAGLWTAPVQEAAEEALNQLAENITDKYTGLDEERDIWDNVEEMAWAGAGGGTTHMAMGAPAKVVKGVQNLVDKGKSKKEIDRTKEILKELKREDLSEEERESLTNEMEELFYGEPDRGQKDIVSEEQRAEADKRVEEAKEFLEEEVEPAKEETKKPEEIEKELPQAPEGKPVVPEVPAEPAKEEVKPKEKIKEEKPVGKTIVPEKPKKPKKPVAKKEEIVPEEKPPPDAEGYPDWVEEYSKDSEEVRQVHQKVIEQDEGKLEPWQEDMLGRRVNRESFDRFGDRNLHQKEPRIRLNWFKGKNKEGKYEKGFNIDLVAQELSDIHNKEITPQDIVEFITSDPGKVSGKANPLIKKLASKYKKLTGENIEDYKAHRDNEETAAIAEEKVHNFLAMDVFENEDGLINWEEVKNKKDELSWLLDEPEIIELNKILDDENRQREINEELKEGSVPEVETEQPVTGGSEQGPAAEGRVPTEQEKVLNEVDSKIAKLEEQLKDVKSTREKKLATLNERRGLFGETDVTKEGTLLDVKDQFKATPEIFKKALEEEDSKIAAIEQKIKDLKKSRETAGKEAAGQQDLFKKDKPSEDNIITKSGINILGMHVDDQTIKNLWKKYMRARGNVPVDVFKRWMRAKGNINRNLAHAHFLVRDLKSAMRTAYGQTVVRTPKVSQEELAKINRVLTEMGPGADRAKVLEVLPEVLHEPLIAMRDHIDAMSREMIRTGLVEGNVDLMIKMAENLGFYMTRTYKAHTDPSWTFKNIPSEIVERAKSFVRLEFPEMSENEIEGALKGMLKSEDGVFAAISSGKMGQKDLGILKKRKDVPRVIQDFLGVYEDPMYNYSTSISKMANLIERQKFLEEMKEMGMGEFLFSKKTGDHVTPIATEGDYRFHPLSWVNRWQDEETGEMRESRSSLYTTPEIAESFANFNKADSIHPLTRAYMKWLNVPVKYGKTILSPVTHARNYYANFLFHVLNGRFPFGKAGAKAHATIVNELRNKKGDEFRDYYERLVELNVIGESTRAGEVHDSIKDADYMENFDRRGDNIFKKLSKKTLRTLEKAYQVEDDVHKIIAFEGEKSRYAGVMRKRNPDATDAEINRMAEEKAGEIVRNTMPTYSLVPKMIKQIRRVPLVGTFVSFPAEVIRTSANAMALAAQEIQSADTAAIGAMRIAGIMSAATVTGAIAALSRGLLGFDKEDDEDMRRFMASWSAKSELIILANDGGGNYRYVDVGFSDPFNYLKKPLYALLKGDKNWEEKVWEAAKEMSEPFIGEELLASRLMDIQRNTTKETGKQVYNPEKSPGDQQAAKLKYLWEGVQPGAIYTGKRISKSFRKELKERGGLNPVNELTNLFLGLRSSPVNVGESFGFKVYRAGGRIGDAQNIFYKVRDKADVSEKDKKKAFRDADNATKAIMLELHEDYKAALRLGVPQEVLISKIDNLKKGKYQASRSVKKMVVTGKYVGLDPETGHFRKPRKGYKLK